MKPVGYTPRIGPEPSVVTTREVMEYLQLELAEIAGAFTGMTEGRGAPVLYVEPPKPREGMLVFADGTEWDPGNGAGHYSYVGGAWVPTSPVTVNLTGHVTSVGAATVLGSFTLAQLSTAVSDANIARIDAAQTFAGTQTFSGLVDVTNGQIKFPATQNASADANTLDDYEEGTWTGTLKGATTDPTTPVTATGYYTKVGRRIDFQITFSNVTTTGAAGQISVTGLPFTTAQVYLANVMVYTMATFGSGSPVGYITGTTITLYHNQSNSAWQATTHNPGTARYLHISGVYHV